jgi:predicted NUDIX family NTP pyrophosphohydrolase
MPRESAGILLWRRRDGGIEVFLVHPGGPFWAEKDRGAWSLPKGELEPGEDPVAAARREFEEETGLALDCSLVPLGSVRQRGGKIVHAFAGRGEIDPARVRSNSFAIEWPRRSGKWKSFPEIDRAEWFPLEEARSRILEGQVPLLDRLLETVEKAPGSET